MIIRHYKGENLVNCRDLGGYQTADGATKFGIALRSAMPINPTEKDIEFLREYGIKTVIDLRGNAEVEEYPGIFDRVDGFDYYHISLLEANPAFSKQHKDMAEMYILSLTEYAENYAAVLRLICSLEKPFMFHCFAGKDRTGLLAALLLGAAGVGREDIVADYQLSYTYFKPFYEKEVDSGSSIIWEKDETKFYSKPETMEKILDYFDEAYGGVNGYLRHIGLSNEEITMLSNILK